MAVDNDTRGWILACISAIACVIGSLIISVDVIIRQFPGKKNFKIEENNSFLSSSLSLSFGVMLFSSLNSMLPSAKSALQVGGFSSKAASFTLIACFLGGAAGIQIVSSLFHRCLPSHVVDCDHYHEDEDPDQETAHKDSETSHHPEFPHAQHDHDQIHSSGPEVQMTNGVKDAILARNGAHTYAAKPLSSESRMDPLSGRRPSLQKRLSRGVSKVLSAGKDQCDDDGPCRGFSEPCGQECFNNVFRKGSLRSSVGILRHPGMGRSTTQPATVQTFIPTVDEHQPLLQDRDNALGLITSAPTPEQLSSEQITSLNSHPDSHFSPISSDRSPLLRRASHHSHLSQHSDSHSHHRPSLTVHPSHQPSTQHHHHVPTNPYLTLSLQTTLAIALHKLPEGFITYAANHASPRLGFTVFFSLFIHNISEGFAMALPLYLALHSRWKAICWSSILGGLSQPLGAGVAALWFGVAGKFAGNEGDENDGQGLQGGLIAVTAGIMTSVALQLFAQALDKSHNRDLCMVFAFVGMGILSISNAVVA